MRILAEFKGRGGALIRVVRGDLALEEVDAIVNAANGQLRLGGGVAGAVRKRGGPSIQAECARWVREHGEVPVGGAAITGAGELPARHVIHAVGPVWGTGDEERKLALAVRSALELAKDRGCATVALPAISSGIFGFPKERCAEIILETVDAFAGLVEIRLTNLDDLTAGIFRDKAAGYRGRN